jgi:predicted RecA/RadA family phage recombinase
MATNLIAAGEVLDYTVQAGETISSGDPVLVGDTVGVALVDGVEDDVIPVQICGVFELTKRAHASTAAISQGDVVYFDESAGKIDNTSDSATNKIAGVAYEAAASTATTVKVKLVSGSIFSQEAAANQAANATANGSDAASTQALANALKTDFNALLAKLKAAGLMVAD